MRIKSFIEFSLFEDIEIKLDLEGSKRRGEEKAQAFNKFMEDSVEKFIGREMSGKFDKLLIQGELTAQKVAGILMKAKSNKLTLSLVVLTLMTTKISDATLKKSFKYLDQETRNEIMSDSSVVKELKLQEEKPETIKVETVKKKEIECVQFHEITKSDDQKKSNQMRDDDWGHGHFGAGRTGHSHQGIDLLVKDGKGEGIYAPIDGYVKRTDVVPYAGYQGIDIIGIGQDSGLMVRINYLDEEVEVGDTIRRGDLIGKSQNLQTKYNSKHPQARGRGNIDNHVHVEVKHTENSPVELIDMSVREYQKAYGKAQFINPEHVLVVNPAVKRVEREKESTKKSSGE